MYREANLMASIPNHPNVVRYFGAVLQNPNYALVMEVPPISLSECFGLRPWIYIERTSFYPGFGFTL